MTFGEKLWKLRKEKNLSQEALAEKLNATRQAVSKWENGQGFPEMEKLLMLSNIFEVSVDYLLHDREEPQEQEGKGYYVSREMAEGYLLNEKRTAGRVALGVSILILALVPYLLFRSNSAVWVFAVSVLVALGVGIFLFAGFRDDEQYSVLKKEPLLFDAAVIKEFTARLEQVKKKSFPLICAGAVCIFAGGLPFLFVKKHLVQSVVLEESFPVCILLVSAGLYSLIRAASALEAYDLLVHNEKYVNSAGAKLRKKFLQKLNSAD